LSVLASTYSPTYYFSNKAFQQNRMNVSETECSADGSPSRISQRNQAKEEEKKKKNEQMPAVVPRLSARSTPLPRRLRPHRHRTATPQPTRGDTPNSEGSRDTHAHAHTHPSICILPRPLQRLQSAPHLPHRLRSFSSPLHSIARHTIRRPAASLLPVPVQLELRAERPRRRFTLPTEVILSPFLSLGLPPE
jgi:hypothetical protein